MKFWALLALAASVAVQAFPLEDYKAQLHTRDSDAEAKAIHKNGGKAVQSSGNGGRQIGPGLYILNLFQAWGDNDPDRDIQWDCVVTFDADEWDKWNKVYLPKLFTFPEDAEKKKDTT
ncbi:hypothetical protein E8E12_000334 [Didymella heteroderae]|uniref:Uncharacterized protein n=1 Tax=Didymella heteroderae TaxID=1769908 RepID=A0A9P4WRW8_9PLEO|nr:hypothetical protein E8E12_000334 [Didymella heteroderae]